MFMYIIVHSYCDIEYLVLSNSDTVSDFEILLFFGFWGVRGDFQKLLPSFGRDVEAVQVRLAVAEEALHVIGLQGELVRVEDLAGSKRALTLGST